MPSQRIANRLSTIDWRYATAGMRRLAIRRLGLAMPRFVPAVSGTLVPAHLAALAATPICPPLDASIVAVADRFLVGGIELLGRDVQPWQHSFRTDPRTGYEWPGDSMGSRAGELPPGTDVKLPWETSRFYFAPWLAAASAVTGDARYVRALLDLIDAWRQRNPPGRGVNWSVAMEASIRSANWVVSLSVLGNGSGGTVAEEVTSAAGELALVLEPVLAEHGAFVNRNLERGPGPPTNHLLVGEAGLAFIGWALRSHRKGRKWFRRSRRLLERDALRQIDSDGAHREQSPSYHRFCMEALLAAAWLFRSAGEPSARIERSVEQMWRFVGAYSRPDQSSPQLGDGDNGRFTVPSGLFAHELDHHDYLQWMLPEDYSPVPPGEYEIFREAGYVFLRTDDYHRHDGLEEWASFRCGSFGKYGGHVHADQLHVTWSLGPDNVLIDRGTGDYTGNPDLRNEMRSGRIHNAPIVDGLEPNLWYAADLFYMQDTTRARLSSDRGRIVRSGESTDLPERWVSGIHTGFARRGIQVERRVAVSRGLTIRDTIRGDGHHQLSWCFTLAGEWELLSAGSVPIAATGIVNDAGFRFEWPPGLVAELNVASWSPSYGDLADATELRLAFEGTTPADFEFTLKPVSAGPQVRDVSEPVSN